MFQVNIPDKNETTNIKNILNNGTKTCTTNQIIKIPPSKSYTLYLESESIDVKY
jgi:hypothetical protein